MSDMTSKAVEVSERVPTSHWSPSPPAEHAHVISSDEEAIAIAEDLRVRFLADAGSRDKHRRLPFDEIDVFSQSGLWGITIPKAYGGAGVS